MQPIMISVVVLPFLCTMALSKNSDISCDVHFPCRITEKLVDDLMLEGYNYILVGERFSPECNNQTCERYTLSNIEQKLQRKGMTKEYLIHHPNHQRK